METLRREFSFPADGVPDRTSSLQNAAIAIEVVFPALALLVLGLRTYIRTITRTFGWDDGWMWLAMVISLAQAVVSIFCIKLRYMGIPRSEVPTYDPTPGLLATYISGIIYTSILPIVRTSVLVFLLRLGGTKDGLRIAIWIIGVLNLCLMVAIIFAVTFICQPVEYNWKPFIEGGECLNTAALSMSITVLTIVTDIVVCILPFWVFSGLHIAKKAKFALMFVFLLGFSVTIVSCVRFWILIKIFMFPPTPSERGSSIGYVTSAIETNLGIIAASGPALWPLARRWFPHLFARLGLSQGYQGDIPDIEQYDAERARGLAAAASPMSAAAAARAAKKRSLAAHAQRRRSPPMGMKKSFAGAAAAGGGLGVHTNHSIGGTEFALKNLRGDRAVAHAEIRSYTPNASEEEIMTYNGIMRTTDVIIQRDVMPMGMHGRGVPITW